MERRSATPKRRRTERDPIENQVGEPLAGAGTVLIDPYDRFVEIRRPNLELDRAGDSVSLQIALLRGPASCLKVRVWSHGLASQDVKEPQ